MESYKIIQLDSEKDIYEDTDVPGAFRSFTNSLACQQVAISQISIPPHSDFEQSTGHSHSLIEEIYIILQGTLTMRFDSEVVKVNAGSIVRVDPGVIRSHRNESDQQVEVFAVSPISGEDKADLIRDFWAASDLAKQKKTN